MKLLIVTQVVDSDHPILGFFHRWIEEFSKHCDEVHVIALEVGKLRLPTNVYVHSLGKERGVGRLTYLWRFYKYSWQLRPDYDAVFVHMVPLYAVLGAPLWRFILRKRVGLWYVHGAVEWPLRLAARMVQVIFTAAPEGFNLTTNKVQYTGHGIDTVIFAPDSETEKDFDLITVGRLSPSKNIETLFMLLAKIRQQHDVHLTIVGAATDEEYETSLERQLVELGLTDSVHFYGSVSQTSLPRILNRAKVFVTTATNGSLDKVVLEAMACDLPVVSMAPGTTSLPLGSAQAGNKDSAAAEISKEISAATHTSHRTYIEENHSLAALVPKLLIPFR